MNHPRHRIRSATPVLALLALLGAQASLAGSPRKTTPAMEEPLSAQELVREVIYNENQAQLDDQSLWRYRALETEGGKTELLDVLETREGTIQRLLAINHHPLTASQRRREDARLRRLAANPQAVVKASQNRHQDAEQGRKLMDLLPDAFVYEYDGSEGDEIRLRFQPNPNFRPPNREAQVFHHMEGTMWVDRRQKRLAAIEGRLTSEVKFGYGLLGHLNEGGTFYVKQQDEGAGHWEMTDLDVEMSGRALFFKTIGVQEKESLFDFEQMPDDTTLEQGESLLEENGAAPAKAALASGKKN
ncbi:MAG TPA: hypothetical protein VGS20_06645 [Candidatus Acidoferrales bacterium]|nr:hypothetical protein [Candidatus Acidoferrales bacterium]